MKNSAGGFAAGFVCGIGVLIGLWVGDRMLPAPESCPEFKVGEYAYNRLTGQRVLVVDDDPYVLDYRVKWCGRSGEVVFDEYVYEAELKHREDEE